MKKGISLKTSDSFQNSANIPADSVIHPYSASRRYIQKSWIFL